MVGADSLKDAEHTYSIDIGSKFRSIEADLNVALGSKVVNLGRLYLAYELDERH